MCPDADTPTAAVDRLIDDMRRSPTRLPLVAISAVHNCGHNVRVDASADRVIAVVSPRRDHRLDVLTPREHQVATLIACGYTNRQIAVALSITLGTTKDHVHAILTKTSFETRSQMIAAWYGGLET
jgi:DNA-binding NarL/FixJ family response regulator